jgi:cell wall assembly regulator SMI1
MHTIWNEIKNKLQTIAPDIVQGLLPGVTDAQLQGLEKQLDVKLPEAFVDFYKIHNGQNDTSPWMIDGEILLPFEQIYTEWSIWDDLLQNNHFVTDEGLPYTSEPEKGIKNVWWNSKWIPFTYDGCGNHLCLDLDPDTGGHYGQVIRMWHDDAERIILAISFTDWIKEYAEKLKNGDLVYADDYAAIINKKDL